MRSSYGVAACLMAGCIALSAPASAAVTVTDRISNNGTDDILFTYTGG
ncbi:MAG: hypothetical protein JO157_01245, partial [Acetobacteraceae bacterium]|nr:hypothetical protein [Acetobacteraceae bacterium]